MHRCNAEALTAVGPRIRVFTNAAHGLPFLDSCRVTIGNGHKGSGVDILPDVWDDCAIREESPWLRVDKPSIPLEDCWPPSNFGDVRLTSM